MCEPQKPPMTPGLPMSAPAVEFDAREAVEIGAGEDEMLVAGEDRVDALDAREIERGVLHPVGGAGGVDAGMR